MNLLNKFTKNEIKLLENIGLNIENKEYTNEFRYCLKCDKDFYEDHIALSPNIEICSQNSAYFVVKEIEEKEGFIIKLFKKISKIISKRTTKRIGIGRNY